MKKIYLITINLILISLFVGCGQSRESTLSIYNYGHYIEKDLLTEFEEEFNVKINYEEYPTPEDMYTKVKAGGTNYDLIITGEYMIERMIAEDMLAKIDYTNIPNYQDVDENFKNMPYDPNDEYSVPYFWGTLGIIYNTEVVDYTPDSWDLLWDEDYSGQILMMDSQRDSIAAALKKLGYSLNTTDENELEEAKNLLIEQKPLVMAYIVDEAMDMMIADEASISLIWSGEAVAAMGENNKLNYYVPKEGSNLWIDAACIPKDAENKDLAEKFINFVTDKENTLRNIDYVWYSTVHTEAAKEVEEFLLENPAFNPSQEIIDKAEMFRDLGDELRLYDNVWTEVIAN